MRAIVVANGQISPDTRASELVGPGDLIVCANGGTANALALGLHPDVVIGDLDSMTSEIRRQLGEQDTEIIEHPARKDETDTELAFRYCLDRGVSEILFLGALGGRLDHMLANLLLLADPAWRSIPVRLVDGLVSIQLCMARCRISGQPGDIVSLLPWGGDVKGILTEGLEYPLRNEPLLLGSARGVSNVMLGRDAVVMVREGSLLVIHLAGE